MEQSEYGILYLFLKMKKVYGIPLLACLSFHYAISAIFYVHLLYIYCKFMHMSYLHIIVNWTEIRMEGQKNG